MRSGLKWVCAVVAITMLLGTGDADAKKRRRRKKKAKASAASVAAVKKLMGEFKWGQTSKQVLDILEKQVRMTYKPKIKKERDPILQDRMRREMAEDLKKVKQGHVRFVGKRSPWDVSLIEKEFAHKNNESMVVRWSKRDRRFYFFHFGKLWKVYIGFNATLFRGKSFTDFQRLMEKRFGAAEAKWKLDLRGNSEMSHIEWPAVGDTVLLALDETAFYGNFCLVLINKSAAARVRQARKLNAPKKKYSDPLVNAAVAKPGRANDPNSDIVDRLTGKKKKGTRIAPRQRTIRPGEVAPEGRHKKAKRGKKDDPLSGLDI